MMMMGGRAGAGGVGAGGGRCPFTATQWQELEHQALIYKYMASGVPIPSDLLLPLRRSFLLDSALAPSPSLAFPPQAALGWGCFGMGFGRKAEDPEPGRCRRTDGKKWRCSKEAYPDSKYCEKHMHRGKNRSRKPVEMSLATPPPPPSSSASSSSSNVNDPKSQREDRERSCNERPSPRRTRTCRGYRGFKSKGDRQIKGQLS
uniref:Growth-regulating factor n=1 Tax=Aegilops tauschii TaxID=37682 RepID=M8BBH2_AEGTA